MNKLNRVIVKPFGKDKFEVVEDFIFESIKVPKGYKSNGANVPRLLWSIFPPNSPEYLSATILHDYLCDVADSTVKDNILKNVNFKYADDMLLKALLTLSVNKFKSRLFYFSCRLYHKIKYRQ
ncbi:DUF1353 domain-containing protein [Campylobacter pinnipediorum]|uniref:DUF1353 domain protein n=1 Tax=Campylobacter pinnipediorum subsp. pinnipediorum TaxID=1660067 RepID=A0AAX0LA40_9BACT|nr:DUF1353 domain-containing protein [Campylobacter pinnipediorum]OPA77246.1 hypothetical protein BFG04_03895 [Campylobacter pinnipediorum subsp. pinnipediorum]OPA77332.1 hypothetical protein BFG04_04350 [Campylobacter pinnipediorum subsp. pinnipediorum]